MDLVPAPRSEPLRVLLVDGHTALCESLSQLLKMDGLAVTAAHDGEAGVREAPSCAFEIVILDVMLPVSTAAKFSAAFACVRKYPSSCSLPTAMTPTALPASKPAPTTISPSLSILANWSPVFGPSFADAPPIRLWKFSPSEISKSN
jgi:Response regulator receiver domain